MGELWRVKERSLTFDEFWWSLLWEKTLFVCGKKIMTWVYIKFMSGDILSLLHMEEKKWGLYGRHWQWFKWFSLEITPPPDSWMSHFPKQTRRQQRDKRIESQCDICLACMLMFHLLICEFFRHKMTKFQQVQIMPWIILYNELFTHYITGK